MISGRPYSITALHYFDVFVIQIMNVNLFICIVMVMVMTVVQCIGSVPSLRDHVGDFVASSSPQTTDNKRFVYYESSINKRDGIQHVLEYDITRADNVVVLDEYDVVYMTYSDDDGECILITLAGQRSIDITPGMVVSTSSVSIVVTQVSRGDHNVSVYVCGRRARMNEIFERSRIFYSQILDPIPQHRIVRASPSFYSPISYSVYAPGSVMTLKWYTTGFTDDEYADRLILYRASLYWDVMDDKVGTEIDISSVRMTDGTVSITLPSDISPSVSPYYFVMKYKCWLLNCNEDSTPLFTVPMNIDPWCHHASNVSSFQVSCDSCTSSSSTLCTLCNHGLNFNVTGTMRALDVVTSVYLTRFQFDNDGTDIKVLDARINGSVYLSTDLETKGSVEYSGTFSKKLINHLPIYARSFSLAGITLDLGFFFDLESTVQVEIIGAVHAVVPIDISIPHLEIRVLFGTEIVNSPVLSMTYDQPIAVQGEISLTANAHTNTKLQLIPVITCDLASILTASASLPLYIDVHGDVTYPASPPSPYGVIHPTYLYHYPSRCDNPHFLEYSMDVGIGNVTLSADIHIDIVVYKYSWSSSYDIDTHYNVPLLAGCLLNASDTASRAIMLIFTKSAVYQSQVTFMYQLRQDLGRALDVQPVSLMFAGASVVDGQFRVSVMILPGENNVNIQSKTNQLHDMTTSSSLPDSLAHGDASQYIDTGATRQANDTPVVLDENGMCNGCIMSSYMVGVSDTLVAGGLSVVMLSVVAVVVVLHKRARRLENQQPMPKQLPRGIFMI